VPDLHFGRDYRVALQGGELVGGLGTQVLRLRACPGAAAVTVEVTDEAPAPALTCPERAGGGGPASPPQPGGTRVKCPRGNSPSVRCSRTTLADGRAALQVVGTRRSELLVGTRGVDVIVCGAGNDRALGRGGRDTIRCGPGNDRIWTGPGADLAYGGSGSDLLAGEGGRDRLTGGTGRDRFSGGANGDRLLARDGRRELVRCGGGRDRVSADRTERLARDCERR
jgi:hypothetical protein